MCLCLLRSCLLKHLSLAFNRPWALSLLLSAGLHPPSPSTRLPCAQNRISPNIAHYFSFLCTLGFFFKLQNILHKFKKYEMAHNHFYQVKRRLASAELKFQITVSSSSKRFIFFFLICTVADIHMGSLLPGTAPGSLQALSHWSLIGRKSAKMI